MKAVPVDGDESPFPRELVVTFSLTSLDDSLAVTVVLTTGNVFFAAGPEEEVDLLLNKDPKIDLLDFSPLAELLLLIVAFDNEEIGGS